MIPPLIIKQSSQHIPWAKDEFIEQDLIINKSIVDLYNNPIIAENLLFRGGTALNKICLNPPSRYSEDLDFVIAKKNPVGFLMDAVRDSLAWLGRPRTKRDKYGFKLIFAFNNVAGLTSKLKIETNCEEIFHAEPLRKVPFSFQSAWFSGTTNVHTYTIEEIMATKIRAVFQRKKGRDLFDVWYVFSNKLADLAKSIDMFKEYNKYNQTKISQRIFYENLMNKKLDKDFRSDINALIPVHIQYDFDTAFEFFLQAVIPKI